MINERQSTKPFVLTIFGASGDLAKIKIFPSLYMLLIQKKLQKEYFIIGFARTEKTNQEFREEFKKSILDKYPNADLKILDQMLKKTFYVSGQYDKKESYLNLIKEIDQITNRKKYLRINYLSVPPTVFKDIIKNLGELPKGIKKDTTLIIEKPFGGDVISSTQLYYFVVQYFEENQIYLLDHYLGKQAVRSVIHMRHHNRILNTMLKGREVKNIQITAIEDIGIENRIGYFDQVGIIRDMIQSHLLQLLALVTMSIPITGDASAIQQEKESVLSAVTFSGNKNKIVIGQYKGYRDLPETSKTSMTETFAAIRLFINRESWHQVPIYIRTGKKLHKKYTSIVVTLKKSSYQKNNEEPNRVIFELYPNEKLSITLLNKYGQSETTKMILPEHSLACEEDVCLPEHANLLLESIRQDRKYFLSFPEIIASWKVTDKIIDTIKRQQIKMEIYDEGDIGPKSQCSITNHDGNDWFNLYKYK